MDEHRVLICSCHVTNWSWLLFFPFYSETAMEEDDELYYDCVYREDEGDEVYEDLMKVEVAAPNVR